MDFLLSNANLPFAVALAVLVLLAVVQLIGLGDLLGDADADVDIDVDADAELDIVGGLASVIGFGRLPLLVWLSLLLAVFALLGLGGQQAMLGFTGDTLPALPAAGLAGLVALPLTGALSRPLARILPHDETTAVGIDSLIAKRGIIEIGRATRGSPARAAVGDRFGHIHHVMVEPNEDGEVLESGVEVLLVRREGDIFHAIAVEARPF
ncbi:OB-fold-containig protein [Stakelama tenebrarum]|uniref:YqiJ family protein n=1 Tax=Stakelama tenebrarum TaxID=2711215 RepID=A0A6G6Y7X0_9SPHN|nr:OB-fold-containig protein [Sphingosinithalassobacter tenebrarum]QIG81009.1 YqiJ family protein [Sphingosinithalassobacter tenebrarum]